MPAEDDVPGTLGFRMPEEWEPHAATWLAWPHKEDSWPGNLTPIPAVWGEIVSALAPYEAVNILVNDSAMAARVRAAKIRLLKQAANPWYEVTLIEGRNRQIRRMFEQVGHHVEKIKRVRYGPLELDVETGKFRPLTVAEVGRLKAAVRQRTPARGKTPRHPKSGRRGGTGQAAS